MTSLLKFEFRKLVRQKSLYICMAILLFVWVMSSIVTPASAMVFLEALGEEVVISPFAYSLSAVYDTSHSLLMAIIVVLFVCTDTVSGAIKNVYARGFTRMQVYAAKWIVCLTFSLGSALLLMVLTLLPVTLICGVESSYHVGTYLVLLLGELLTVVASTSLSFVLAMLIRKRGNAIAAAILLPVAITTALSIVDMIIYLGTLYMQTSPEVSCYWIDYFYVTFCDALEPGYVPLAQLLVTYGLTLVYTAAFHALGIRLYTKRDV